MKPGAIRMVDSLVTIKPNETLDKVIKMNQAIIDMNAEIVRVLAHPMYVVKSDRENDAKEDEKT